MPARLFRHCELLALVLSALPAFGEVAADRGSLRPWNAYHVIMWVGDTVWKHPDKLPLFLDRLREMGVDTAMVSDGDSPQPFVTSHFPYYVENIVNRGLCLKWNSKVADWDRFVTDWARQGRPKSAFVRPYCFDDPSWLDWARAQMRAAAHANSPYGPLAYNIRDELSVTYSANPFDYDFSPAALAGFRRWLKTQYPDLAALNTEWETRFGSWNQVIPFSTDQIKNRMASGEAQPRGQPNWQRLERCRFDPASAGQDRTRWNFAPWCDFRTYMDVSLARTLNDLREAAHDVDSRTPVGIEGTQMPDAFGGYDLWRLSRVLDWVEAYDIGNAREIFASFMPGKPILTTVFEKETNPARRRLWHLLLEGDRGCIVWWSEDCIDWSRPDYELTAKAMALAPVLKEMKSPLAELFLRARREFDPIAFVYSQPSIQVDWLLESTVDGSTWPRRFSSYEANHNRMVKVRDAWLKAFEDLGCSPRFIPASELAQPDALAGVKVLVLPSARALSTNELAGLEQLLRSRARLTVFADGLPGDFDEHGRVRPADPLTRWFPSISSAQGCVAVHGLSSQTATPCPGDIADYRQDRLASAPQFARPRWIGSQMRDIAPAVSAPLKARVRVYRFHLGKAQLLAFERNIDYQMSEELKQGGGNEALEKPIEVTARLPGRKATGYLYDLRTGRCLGRSNEWTFTLEPWRPSLFALWPEKVPADRVISVLLSQ